MAADLCHELGGFILTMNKIKEITKLIFYKILKMPRKIIINNKSFNVKYNRFWQSVEDGRWETETFKVFDKYLEPNFTFLDIGAWNGVTSFYAAQTVKKCYAIEPDTLAIEELKINLNYNPDLKDKIILYPYCFNKEDGEKPLYADKFGNSTSSLIENSGRKKSVTVQSKTFQDFLEEETPDKIDFIKMDIEGGERFVLPTMKSYLEENKPILYLSLHLADYKFIKEIKDIIEIMKIYDEFYLDNKKVTLDEIQLKLIDRENFEVLMK